MIEKFIQWAESLTAEKIGLCVLVMLIAAFSLGFCVGKQTEKTIEEQRQPISDWYKMDLVQTYLSVDDDFTKKTRF